ncbi:hypothetical protein B0H13DRAFT_2356734 [Mycena leptocephala]|nr:hypothetical protein B0H13DRAFT_2356734 [Mycena leptocephala]
MVVVLYAWNVALGNGARRRTRPPGGDSDGDHQRAPPFMRILLRRVTRVGARADANSSSRPASPPPRIPALIVPIGLAFLDRDRQWLRAAAPCERARRRCGYCEPRAHCALGFLGGSRLHRAAHDLNCGGD